MSGMVWAGREPQIRRKRMGHPGNVRCHASDNEPARDKRGKPLTVLNRRTPLSRASCLFGRMQTSFDPGYPLGNAVQFLAHVRQAVVYDQPDRAETDYECRNQNRGQGKRCLDQFIQTHFLILRHPPGDHGKISEGMSRVRKLNGNESTVDKRPGYRFGA